MCWKYVFIATTILVLILPVSAEEVRDSPFDVGEVIQEIKAGSEPADTLRDPDEFLIDTSVTYYPARGEYPSVGFDGTNHLVVWSDYDDILGTRVNQSGVVMDSAGIAISIAESWQKEPSVVFGDSCHLVVWVDKRDEYWGDVYGARVNPEGVVLDPDGIAISTAVGPSSSPSVAFDGTNFLVVWDDWVDIYGARVNQAGVVLDPNGITIATSTQDQYDPSVAYDGTNYLVVWSDQRNGESDIYGARVNRAGVVLDPEGFSISTKPGIEGFPAVAFDGTNHLVVWNYRPEYYWKVYGARVDQSGMVLDTNAIPIMTTYAHLYPSVAFDGTNYLVVWIDVRDNHCPYGARVDQSGIVLDPDGFVISTHIAMCTPSVAFGGMNYLVVWDDLRHGVHPRTYGARVSKSGRVLDPNGTAKSIAVRDQESPKADSDGTNYLVTWGEGSVYAARLSRSGVVLDSSRIAVARGSDDKSHPSVAFGGNRYFVAWQDERLYEADIYGTPVDQSGAVLWPGGRFISRARFDQLAPSVVSGGADYLVVWHDCRSSRVNADIYGARVNQSGVVVDTNGVAISAANDEQRFPAAAFNGVDYFVVWEDGRNGSGKDVYGARVDQSAVVLDTSGILIAALGNEEPRPAVAFDGTNYLVVWGNGSDVCGARVSQDGEVLDPRGIAICTAESLQAFPSVVFDGSIYVVIWEDNRNGFFTDIYGALVNPSGRVIDSFPVSIEPRDQKSPALACGAENQVLLTYSGWAGVVQGKIYNSMRIWGKLLVFTGVAEQESLADGRSCWLQSRPNPFTGMTAIRYSVVNHEWTALRVFDVAGRTVRTLFSGVHKSGTCNVRWDGTDDTGRKLPAGVYYCRLELPDGTTETKELLYLR